MATTREPVRVQNERPATHGRKQTTDGPGVSRTTDEGRRESDACLVQRCVAGEVLAWEELYDQCHPPLLQYIKSTLGSNRGDPNLADELAARVWYALVADDGELLTRYDPKRGARLLTFIRAIAKDQMCRYFRSEKRRRKREAISLRASDRESLPAEMHMDVSFDEFLESLPPREQEFVRTRLLDNPNAVTPAGDEPEISLTNAWQLTHRIRMKLVRFLGMASSVEDRGGF